MSCSAGQKAPLRAAILVGFFAHWEGADGGHRSGKT